MRMANLGVCVDVQAAPKLEQVKDAHPERLQHAARAERHPSLLGMHLHARPRI